MWRDAAQRSALLQYITFNFGVKRAWSNCELSAKVCEEMEGTEARSFLFDSRVILYTRTQSECRQFLLLLLLYNI